MAFSSHAVIVAIIAWLWLRLAHGTPLQFQRIDPDYLLVHEDTAINVTAIRIVNSTLDPATLIYVVVQAEHGAFAVHDMDAWQSRVRRLCDWDNVPASFAPTRSSTLAFEATLSTANDILGALDYLPPPQYNFDWTSSRPCIRPDQSLESIRVYAVAAPSASPSFLSQLSSACRLDDAFFKLDRSGGVLFNYPIAIAAVNDPPELFNMPSSPLHLSPGTCFPLPGAVADSDVNEIPNRGGALRVRLTASSGLTIRLFMMDVVNFGIGLPAKTAVVENYTHIEASSIVLQSGQQDQLNAFLPLVSICLATSNSTTSWNTSLRVVVDDGGGCGTLPSASPAAFATIAVMANVPPPDLSLAPSTNQTLTVNRNNITNRFRYVQRLTLSTNALDVVQRITVSAPFTKEIQLVSLTSALPMDQGTLELSFTFGGVTSSAVIDVAMTAPEVAQALTSQWTNAGDISTTITSSLLDNGAGSSMTWAITFQTLAGTSIPLIQATAIALPLAGGVVDVSRRSPGSQIAPEWTLHVTERVAGGTFIVDVVGTCNVFWPAFSTTPLPARATPLQIQVALQAHQSIDQVNVVQAAPLTFVITFWTNVYTACPTGLAIVARFFGGHGQQSCSTCTTGIASVSATQSNVGSQEMQASDMWRFVSPAFDATPWMTVVTSTPFKLQQVLPPNVAVAKMDCANPALRCMWEFQYVGPLLTVQIASPTLVLANEVRQAQPMTWSKATFALGDHLIVAASVDDIKLTNLLATWCRCSVNATTIEKTSTRYAWAIYTVDSIEIQAIPISTWIQVDVSPLRPSDQLVILPPTPLGKLNPRLSSIPLQRVIPIAGGKLPPVLAAFAAAYPNDTILAMDGKITPIPPEIIYTGPSAYKVRPGRTILFANLSITSTDCRSMALQLDVSYGKLWLDLSVRFYVRYKEGSKDGGQHLVLESTCKNLKTALRGLYYTANASFYGQDELVLRLNSTQVRIAINVPLTLSPPEITATVRALHTLEDTELALLGFAIQPSPTTPSNCSTTLTAISSVGQGTLYTSDRGRQGRSRLKLQSTDGVNPLKHWFYKPNLNFAGLDKLIIRVEQSLSCSTGTTEAELELPILVDPVPDPVELAWICPPSFQVEWPTTLLPTAELTSVDAEFALFPNYHIELIGSAQLGSLTFGAIKGATVVCTIDQAIAYLSSIQYTPPPQDAKYGETLVDLVQISAREFGNTLFPPAVVQANLSMSIPIPACALFSVPLGETSEDSLLNLTWMVHLLVNGTAKVKKGWLLCPSCYDMWAKQTVVAGDLIYQPDPNYYGEDTLEIECGMDIQPASLPLAIYPVNDAPEWVVDSTTLQIQDTTSLCRWKIEDVDPSESYRVTLTAQRCSVKLSSLIPSIFVEPQTNQSALQFQGRLANVNNLLQSCKLEITPPRQPLSHLDSLQACVREKTVDGDWGPPQCISISLQILPSTRQLTAADMPQLSYTQQWNGVEDTPAPLVGLQFSSRSMDFDQSISVNFQAAKGTVDIISFASCLQRLAPSRIAGDIVCLQQLFSRSDSIWYRPYPNQCGFDTVTVTYGLDQVVEVPVYMKPVVDVPVWRNVSTSFWHIVRDDQVSWRLSSTNPILAIKDGDVGVNFELDVRISHGKLDFGWIPGLYYPIQQDQWLRVVGEQEPLNTFVQSLQYTPTVFGINDTLVLTLQNTSEARISIHVADEPMVLETNTTYLAVEVNQSIKIPLIELRGSAKPLVANSWTISLSCQFGRFIAGQQNLSLSVTTKQGPPEQLNQFLSAIVYQATNLSDIIHIRLLDDDVVTNEIAIQVETISSYMPIQLQCVPATSPKLVQESQPVSIASWFDLTLTGEKAPDEDEIFVQVDVFTTSSEKQLRLPLYPGLRLNTLDWTSHVWVRGLAVNVVPAINAITLQPFTDSDKLQIAVSTPSLPVVNCTVPFQRIDQNHPPSIDFSPEPWKVTVSDADVIKFPMAPFMVSMWSTSATFTFGTSQPSNILKSSTTNLSTTVYSSLIFMALEAEFNSILASLACVDGYGGIYLTVDDQGHGQANYTSLNADQFLPCPSLLKSSTELKVDSTFQPAPCFVSHPCSLPSLSVVSTSFMQFHSLTTTTQLGCIPEIQEIQTRVDNPMNQKFTFALYSTPLAPTTQFQLQVSWQLLRGSSQTTTTTIVCSAMAVASQFEEIRGAGPGRDLGESIQAKLEFVLPVSVQVSYGKSNSWRIEILPDPSSLYKVDIQLVGTTNSLLMDVFPSQPASIISGTFALSFAGAQTPPLACDIAAVDLQTQLEFLPTVDIVQVTRTTDPDSVGGYTWSITFLQLANGAVPLLIAANTSTLKPTYRQVIGNVDDCVGSQARVVTRRSQAGFGQVPAQYQVELRAQHVDLAFDIIVQATTTMLTTVTFQLALPNSAQTTGAIQSNAVAMVTDEGADQSQGGRISESVHAKLKPLFPATAMISITRHGPDANHAFSWHVVVGGVSSTTPLPIVASSTCPQSTCSVRVVGTHAANSLGGTFVLRIGSEATLPLPTSASSSQVETALRQLTWVKQHADVHVRRSAVDLQQGADYALVFLKMGLPAPPLYLDASQLTGIGAYGKLHSVNRDNRVDWIAPPAIETEFLTQKHLGMTMAMEGTAKALNTALSKLEFQSTSWFGTLGLTFELNKELTTVEITVPVLPSTANLPGLVFNPLVVYEDIPLQLVELEFMTPTNWALYATINVTLAVSHGKLTGIPSSNVVPPASTIQVSAATALMPSTLSTLYYQPELNFNGLEQLAVYINSAKTQIFRFNVLPVNDAPLIRIQGSIEGPFTSPYFPIFVMTAPQDTRVSLPMLWIEDVDALAYEAALGTSVLTLSIRSSVGHIFPSALETRTVVQESPSQLLLESSLTRLNAALNRLLLDPPAGFTGNITVTLWVVDRGDGAPLEHFRRLLIQVTPVFKLPPIRIGQWMYLAQEDTSLPISDIQIDAPMPLFDMNKGMTIASRLYQTLVLPPDTRSGNSGARDDWRLKLVDRAALNPQWFCTFQSRLYFAGDSMQCGRELMVSNGLVDAALFADLNPGFSGSNPQYLTVFQGSMYFQASGLDLSYQLTSPGCTSRRTSSLSSDILFVVAQSNTWQVNHVYDCPQGYTWMTTSQAKHLFNGGGDSFVYWNQCGWVEYVFQGISRKWFRFADSATTGAFKHAGRIDGFPIEYSFTATEFAGIVCLRSPSSALFSPPAVLWQSNGITASKVDSTLVYTSPAYLTTLSTSPWLVFQAYSPTYGVELYHTNGLTTYVDDLALGPRSSSPSNFTEFQSRLVFAATSDFVGRELWASSTTIQVNGQPWTYQVVADIAPGAASSTPQDLVVCNGVLYFTADDGVRGREVWKWDGTNAPTLVQDLWLGVASSNPKYLTVYNGKVYFQAVSDVNTGVELYSTNGGAITLVKDIAVGAGSSYPSFLSVQSAVQNSVLQTLLVFCTRPQSIHECIWYKSDGTSSGTQPLWDSTSSIPIDGRSFQVGTFQGSMIYPVTTTLTNPPPTPNIPRLKLDIAVSKGALSWASGLSNVSSSLTLQTWTFQGTTTELNHILGSMVYLAPRNYFTALGAFPVTIQLTLSGFSNQTTATASVFVQQRDDPPVWLVPQSLAQPNKSAPDNLSPAIASIQPFVIQEDNILDLSRIQLRAVDCMDPELADPTYSNQSCILTMQLTAMNGILTGHSAMAPSSSKLTITGTVPMLNQILSKLQYTPARDYVGNDTITLVATLKLKSSVVVPILVTPVNDVPYIRLDHDYFEAFEDEVLILPGISAWDDLLPIDLLQINVAVAFGSISIRYNKSVIWTTPSNGSPITFNGTLAQVSTALRNMTYVSGLHWNSDVGDDYDSIKIRVTDAQGATSSSFIYIRVFPTPNLINITIPYADLATATAMPLSPLQGVSVDEDNILHLSNLTVSCVDAVASSMVTVSLYVQHGALACSRTAGVFQSQSTRSSLLLKGSYSGMNAALATLTYQPEANYAGQDSLVVTANAVDDSGGVSLPGQMTLALFVIALNDAPVWNVPQGAYLLDATARAASLHLDNISFVDVDAGLNDLMELTIDSKDGTVTLAAPGPLSAGGLVLVSGTGQNDAYLAVRGTQTSLNGALAGLVFTLDRATYDGQSFETTMRLRPRVILTIDDLGNTGSGGASVVSTTATIQVVSMRNQPPVLSTTAALPLKTSQDTKLSLANTVAIADPDVNQAFGSIMELTITTTAGIVIVPPDFFIPSTPQTHKIVIKASLEQLQYALYKSYYVADLGWFGQDAIVITVNDLGFTGTGGPQSARLVLPVVVTKLQTTTEP
ncbi:hypothetical protein AC1031_015023 [Aphanomyces cochlioides]|nr:hypothetical protein AC1031_015023 [Aphanomyces cochlioides]